MSIPAEIAGLGSTDQKLRASTGFDALKSGLGPEEYFVLSRIDGTQTARDLLLSTGLPVERGVAILARLRSVGAILLPGETTPPAAGAGAHSRGIPVAASESASGSIRVPVRPTTPPSMGRAQTPTASPLSARTHATTGRVPTQPVAVSSTGRVPTPVASPSTGRVPTQPAQPTHSSGPRAPASPAVQTVPSTGRVPTQPAAARSPTPAQSMSRLATPQAAVIRAAPAAAVASSAPPARESGIPLEERFDLRLPNATREEMTALTEDIQLDDRIRRLVLALRRLVDKNDPHALIGASGDADEKAIKRAYRALSKEIHPDRYYGKRLGSFKDRLAFVFEAVTRAHTRLSNAELKRSSGAGATASEEPQTPAAYAAEIFERACALEVSGDLQGAMKQFAAAVRVDPQTRYLRRAASCAMAAEQPKTAVEYAKKAQAQAPYDPSSARLLASAFRAAGKLEDAEEVLIMAMAMKSENDVLGNELRLDLAEIRRMLGA